MNMTFKMLNVIKCIEILLKDYRFLDIFGKNYKNIHIYIYIIIIKLHIYQIISNVNSDCLLYSNDTGFTT